MSIKPTKRVEPKIYAYSTPSVPEHNGCLKIGYTEQDVHLRIWQQTHTVDINTKHEWNRPAVYADGTNDVFHDSDFHRYLERLHINRKDNTEWFEITKGESLRRFEEFCRNRGMLEPGEVQSYKLRKEQSEAVRKAKDYFETHSNGNFLFNAKPRFGKTLATYALCKELNAKHILIITNRPAIANSWYDDYVKFIGREENSGYWFISDTSALKGKDFVYKRTEYLRSQTGDANSPCIEFVSLQDLKGSVYFGGDIDKLKEVSECEWDLLVIDEAHEGVDTIRTSIALDCIHTKNTLHLSGTPFKAIARDIFPSEARYDWTYADEQEAKEKYDANSEYENPYDVLPRLNMYTYHLQSIVGQTINQNIGAAEEDIDYTFYLNKLFETKDGKFIHDAAVNYFLDALTTDKKFPFSEEYRDQLNHTLWLLSRVDSANALAEKLRNHDVFGSYTIVVAAGTGEEDQITDRTLKDAYTRVRNAIDHNDKTITLTVGQLTTGVTIPEWTGVLMLSSIKSPELYMQTAFRVQNPHLFFKNNEYLRKTDAYIFDFEPVRSLEIYEKIANGLSDNTDKNQDSRARQENVQNLLEYLPVMGEDFEGNMVSLDATEILTRPRKLKNEEVVRKGFASDYLIENVEQVLSAPKDLIAILNNLKHIKGKKEKIEVTPQDGKPGSENDRNNNHDENNILLNHFEGEVASYLNTVLMPIQQFGVNYLTKNIINLHKKSIAQTIMERVTEEFTTTLSKSSANKLRSRIECLVERVFKNEIKKYSIIENIIERERQNSLREREANADEINCQYDEEKAEAVAEFKENMKNGFSALLVTIPDIVKEAYQKEKEKQENKIIENQILARLKGFTSSIPCFLMAYGNENTTLANFDTLTSNETFKEITGIGINEFKILRDGGDIKVNDEGDCRHFDGHLFNEIVFNDSIKKFLEKKKELSNYFDESQKEDIFDYVPSPRSNLVFTPKKAVLEMVNMLEDENPGCFDNPDSKFADLYMKSGMYLAEIIKRLFRSEAMKSKFPNDQERLKHIFKNQIYGCAPNDVIYHLCVNYLLGFSDDFRLENDEHNIKLFDTLASAKEKRLKKDLIDLFGFNPADYED